MKKITLCLLAASLSLTFIPTQSSAASTSAIEMSTTPESERAAALIVRLNTINDMDKTNLSSSDKKGLRKEVRSIKSELTSNSGGIYLTVGAIIIIILLLILLV